MNFAKELNRLAIWKDPGVLFQPSQRLFPQTWSAVIADTVSSLPNNLLRLTYRVKSGVAWRIGMEFPAERIAQEGLLPSRCGEQQTRDMQG
ncbi:hypothetical protein L210DRAFT_3587769, partial [Boletus edulis BED1]